MIWLEGVREIGVDRFMLLGGGWKEVGVLVIGDREYGMEDMGEIGKDGRDLEWYARIYWVWKRVF